MGCLKEASWVHSLSLSVLMECIEIMMRASVVEVVSRDDKGLITVRADIGLS